MKATGIVRRIDDLGPGGHSQRRSAALCASARAIRWRSIPAGMARSSSKSIPSWAGWMILRPSFCETMSRSTGAICAVTDRDSVIAVAGGAKQGELLGKGITAQLEQVMENRRIYQYDGQGPQIPVSDSSDRLMAIVAAPILSEGDLLGLVLFISDSPAAAGDAEYKLAQTVAAFLGRHMEN